jgi:hypothetical protein
VKREQMYAQGFVPTADVAPLLRRGLVADFGEEFYAAGAAGSLPRILTKWESEQAHADYDSVDRALAKVNMLEAWRDEQPDAYYKPVLKDTARAGAPANRCKRSGCSNEIVYYKAKSDYNAKRFCSKRCGDADWQARKRGTKRSYGPGSKLRHMVCAKGHDLTDDNIKPRKDGKRVCRICCRERDRRYRQERRRLAKLQSQGAASTHSHA